MKLHLYQQNKSEAFFLSKNILIHNGFSIQVADEKRGLIAASGPVTKNSEIQFFDIIFSSEKAVTTLSLFANVFSPDQAIFIADEKSESSFVNSLRESLRVCQLRMPLSYRKRIMPSQDNRFEGTS